MKGIGSGRFLLFELDGNQYAIEVERVEVVLETVPITRVPQAPAHLKGVINYRGAVIPVADLRLRFRREMDALGSEAPGAAAPGAAAVEAKAEPGPAPDKAEGESIIVLHLRFAGDDTVMGILADSVREVVDIPASRIEKAPGIGSRGDSGLIAGIGEKDGHFIVLLDIDAAFEAGGLFTARPGPADEARRPLAAQAGETR